MIKNTVLFRYGRIIFLQPNIIASLINFIRLSPLFSLFKTHRHGPRRKHSYHYCCTLLLPWKHACLRSRYLSTAVVLFRCRCLATGLHATIYKYSVRALQETHAVSATRINRLLLCKEKRSLFTVRTIQNLQIHLWGEYRVLVC
jgi:hypothetical protein